MPLALFNADIIGSTDLYVKFQGTDIAVATVPGTGEDLGWFFVPDASLVSAGLPAGIYSGTFQHGDENDPDPSDPLEYFFQGFQWNGLSSAIVSSSAYTSLAEMEDIFSEMGVSLRTDDASDSNRLNDIINRVISDATGIVRQYVWERYQTVDLVNSSWVRERATWIGCYILSRRRGNPAQFIDHYDRIIEELRMIQSRVLHIPDLNVLVEGGPAISNFVVDNRGLGPEALVDPYRSRGNYPGQYTTLSGGPNMVFNTGW